MNIRYLESTIYDDMIYTIYRFDRISKYSDCLATTPLDFIPVFALFDIIVQPYRSHFLSF